MNMKIVPLPDLLRGARAFPESFFDLVREPIRQGTAIDIGFAPGGRNEDGLKTGFDLSRFRLLAGVDMEAPDQQMQWQATYRELPADALDYLFEHLPDIGLLLSFELPPWLENACFERNIPFLDIRPSPLRFGRDLYVALRCSSPTLSERLDTYEITEEEIRLEAALLASNVRMHQRRLEDERGWHFDSLHNSLIFVGQAPYDASLLCEGGHPLRCADFAEQLQTLSKGRRVLHKAHPFALEFSEQERSELARITGQSVDSCQQSAYQILSAHDDVELVGISSGLLQEASWFGKRAHTLFRPFVPLRNKESACIAAYRQVHFHSFISPAFWHALLTPEQPAPRLATLPLLAHNHARETLDHWWDYSKVMTWERTLPYEAFMRSGGAQLKRKVDALNMGGSAPCGEAAVVDSSHLYKELSCSLYSRLSSAYRGFEDVAAKNVSPQIYKGKTLDANYYQRLHENNALFQENNWLLPYIDLIRKQNFSTVREVGCGNGAFVSAIAKSVRRVVGLDWARSPSFPEGENITFHQQDITQAELDVFDLNCSADVLEHIELEKLSQLIEALHRSATVNFHVIACYDDGHSHLSILPPDAWLFLFRQHSPRYRIIDVSVRRGNVEHIVCVISNL